MKWDVSGGRRAREEAERSAMRLTCIGRQELKGEGLRGEIDYSQGHASFLFMPNWSNVRSWRKKSLTAAAVAKIDLDPPQA